jgi:hypothetical protein
MSDTTAIAAIVTSGVVGPGVLGALANRRERARLTAERQLHDAQLKYDRELVDLQELRAVLDDGAQIIRQAMWQLDRMLAFLGEHPRLSSRRRQRQGRARLSELLQEAQQLTDTAALMSGRIALRLGREDEIYRYFDEGMDSFEKLAGAVMPLLGKPWDFMLHKGARVREIGEIVDRHEREFRDARRAMIDAAQRRVGAQVRVLPRAQT